MIGAGGDGQIAFAARVFSFGFAGRTHLLGTRPGQSTYFIARLIANARGIIFGLVPLRPIFTR